MASTALAVRRLVARPSARAFSTLPLTSLHAPRLTLPYTHPSPSASSHHSRAQRQRQLHTTPCSRAANPQAGAPTSSTLKQSAENAKQEAKAVGSAIASAISGNPESGRDADTSGAQAQDAEGSSSKSQGKAVGGVAGSGVAAGAAGGGVSGVGELLKDAKTIGGEVAQQVPQPALLWGAAGVIPYISTAAASVWLARQAKLVATGFDTTLDLDTAQALLLHAQELQLTYGAVILSFLGATHWGFEFSKYGGVVGNRRYLIGVLPVLVAWPSLMLSPAMGLVAQWAAFVAIWFVDLRATTRGWVPAWYSTYRFWLTAFVGTSIIATLAGTQYYDTDASRSSAQGTARRLEENVKQHAKEKRELADQVAQGIKGGSKTVLTGLQSDTLSKSQGDEGDSYVKVENPVREEEERKKKEEEERKKQEEQHEKQKEQDSAK